VKVFTKGEDDGDLHEVYVNKDDVEDLPSDDELGLRREDEGAEKGVIPDLCVLAPEFRQGLMKFTVQPLQIQIRSD
jgi:hypothetical protein